MNDKLFKGFENQPEFRPKNPISLILFILQINDSNVFYNSLLMSKIGLTVPILLKICEDIEIYMFGGPGFEIEG